MESLKDKRVLIIGATGGIGNALVPLLKRSGAVVFLTGRNVASLDEIARENNIDSRNLSTCDIRIPDDVASLSDSVGEIDILVNAAGIGIIKPLESLSHEEFNEVIDINLKGTFNLLKAFLPGMKSKKEGLIINLPGVLGKVPMAGASAYAASKYGLNGMLKSVREELKRTRVRITNLYLGGTDTPFWDEIDIRVQKEKFITAEEAAKAVWFLCQQPSSGVVSEMVLQPFNHQAI